ncbi:RNase H family protein [Metabacillus schmidteae]|uniref:RNase H family protein n=1 Tax=Metabacillus schmidteae TaxID=2730405 RepID=UPI00158AB48E|nr:RNase H family protein [Metabacillus schmidteae]
MNSKSRSSNAQVGKLNFWGKYAHRIQEDKKEWIYEQYLSNDVLYIYCDTSIATEKGKGAIACTYVMNGKIIVKSQLVYLPNKMKSSNIYGELKALNFALSHFHKYIGTGSEVVIYSDVSTIGFIMEDVFELKEDELEKIKKETHRMYLQIIQSNVNLNLSIKYLVKDLQTHNSFYKSAHNTARKLLNKD